MDRRAFLKTVAVGLPAAAVLAGEAECLAGKADRIDPADHPNHFPSEE